MLLSRSFYRVQITLKRASHPSRILNQITFRPLDQSRMASEASAPPAPAANPALHPVESTSKAQPPTEGVKASAKEKSKQEGGGGKEGKEGKKEKKDKGGGAGGNAALEVR